MLFPVVRHRLAVLRDRHHDLGFHRLDHQLPVHDLERYVCEVFIDVLEVVRAQFHRVRSGFGPAYAVIPAEREVRFRVQRIADAYVIPGDRVLLAVVRHRLAVLRDRYHDGIFIRGDRQFACVECDALVFFGGVVVFGIRDRIARGERAVGISPGICALGGGVGNGQGIAGAEAFDGVIIGLDLRAGAGDGGGEGIACLLLAIIRNALIVYRYRHGALGHRQGAKVFGNIIVAGRGSFFPGDGVCVLRYADIGPGAGGGHRDLAFIIGNQAGDGGLVVGQRRAVVDLCSRTGGDGHLRRQDLQTARTDVQADAVVRIIRQVRQGDRIFKIRIVADVFLRDPVIAQAGGGRFVSRLGRYRFPDLIQILFRIVIMADQDILRRIRLSGVRETGQIGFSVINGAGPAVGLDADGDVDLRHLQGAADVPDLVIVRGSSADHRILRGDRSNAGIETAVAVIGTRIIKRDAAQAMAVQQAVHHNLVFQTRRQSQGRSVILLALVYDGYRDFLLIEQGELQTAIRMGIGDLIGAAGSGIGVFRADHGLNQLPAGNGCTVQGVVIADLISLFFRRRDRVAVHIHIVDLNDSGPIGGIVENQDVLFRVRREDQRQLIIFRIVIPGHQIMVDSRGHFDDGSGIAVNRLGKVSMDTGYGILYVVMHRIRRRPRLRIILKGDLIAVRGEFKGQAVFLRTVARHRDGLFGDALPNGEVRVGYYLISQHRLPIHIHIMDRIAQGLAAPVGINHFVFRDLGRPIEVSRSVSCRKPAIEVIALFGGVGLRNRHPIILIHRLGGEISRTAAQVEGDGEGRRDPVGIERQVMPRHSIEGIGILQRGIRIPAAPGIIAVVDGRGVCRLRGRIVIVLAADIRIEEYIVDRSQVRAVEFVFDVIPCAIKIIPVNVHELDIVACKATVTTIPTLAV